jgi:hypothetical protein
MSRTPKASQTPKGRTHNMEALQIHSKSGPGPGSKPELGPDHKLKNEAKQEEGTPRATDKPSTSTNTMGITSGTGKLSRRVEVYA